MWLNVNAVDVKYKVTWGSGRGFKVCYLVGMNSLNDAAQRVRADLRVLSEWATGRPKSSRRDVLARLAKSGNDLFEELFHSPGNEKTTNRVRAWIANNRDDHELLIFPDTTINVPWGLAYEGNPLAPGDPAKSGEMKEFPGFWCLKYRLSALVADFLDDAEWTRPRETFGMVSLVHQEVRANIAKYLPEDNIKEFCEMLEAPLGRARNYQECRERIESAAGFDVLVHFLGHHTNHLLDLGASNTINYREFGELLTKLAYPHLVQGSRTPCSLVFLNGCGSADGDLDLSLIAELARIWICGAIATESIVRKQFAALFGYHFLHSMVMEGKTVGTTMEELHHEEKLWPESLLYGCYAHPDYRIEPPLATDNRAPGPAGVTAEV